MLNARGCLSLALRVETEIGHVGAVRSTPVKYFS